MKKTLTALVATFAGLGLASPMLASPAQARTATTYHNPKVAWVHHVRAHGDTASLRAKYRCWGGDEGTHLWVSLKQGGKINDYTADELSNMEGTSALAKTWYQSHPGDDPGTTGITCDGDWQYQRFTVSRTKGHLKRHHKAFLQFCLFDSHADPTGQDLSHGFAYDYKFVRVH